MRNRHDQEGLSKSVMLGLDYRHTGLCKTCMTNQATFQTQTLLHLIANRRVQPSQGSSEETGARITRKKCLQLHIVLQAKRDRQALSCRICIEALFPACFPVGFLHCKFSLSCREICAAKLTTKKCVTVNHFFRAIARDRDCDKAGNVQRPKSTSVLRRDFGDKNFSRREARAARGAGATGG